MSSQRTVSKHRTGTGTWVLEIQFSEDTFWRTEASCLLEVTRKWVKPHSPPPPPMTTEKNGHRWALPMKETSLCGGL